MNATPPSALKLPSNRALDLPRFDLSAREALAVIMDNSGETFRDLPLYALATAGGANKRGRLLEPFAWEVRARLPDSERYLQALLACNGGLTFGYQQLRVPLPASLNLDGAWIDSCDAAEVILREPLPAGLTDRYTLFCSLGMQAQHGMVWHVERVSHDPTTDMMVRHKFMLDAFTRSLIGEAVTRHKSGALVESRTRQRSQSGEWIDTLR